MNRKRMVEKVISIMGDRDEERLGSHFNSDHLAYCGLCRAQAEQEATKLLDAVLPQIKTFEELQELPEGTILYTTEGSTHVLWKLEGGMWSNGVVHCLLSYALHHYFGELFVIHRPEPE